MQTGIHFEVFGVSEALSESFHSEVMSDASTAMTKDFSLEWTWSCDDVPPEGGVGLWQFVVSTADTHDNAYTLHTICRYGANSIHPPACSWNACADLQCTKCLDGWIESTQELFMQ